MLVKQNNCEKMRYLYKINNNIIINPKINKEGYKYYIIIFYNHYSLIDFSLFSFQTKNVSIIEPICENSIVIVSIN